jgi:hypothetical protein
VRSNSGHCAGTDNGDRGSTAGPFASLLAARQIVTATNAIAIIPTATVAGQRRLWSARLQGPPNGLFRFG